MLYIIEYLVKLEKFGNNLFVKIGHNDYDEWTFIMDGENTAIEVDAIKAFTSAHPGIKGLLFRSMETDVIINLVIN